MLHHLQKYNYKIARAFPGILGAVCAVGGPGTLVSFTNPPLTAHYSQKLNAC